MISRYDRDLRCTYMNHAVERLTGMSTHHIVGKTLRELGMSDTEAMISGVLLHRDRDLKRSANSATLTEQLTAREREILRLVARGWSNREIGCELSLMVGTVKNHVARILQRLDVIDRTQAAVKAHELGLFDER